LKGTGILLLVLMFLDMNIKTNVTDMQINFEPSAGEIYFEPEMQES